MRANLRPPFSRKCVILPLNGKWMGNHQIIIRLPKINLSFPPRYSTLQNSHSILLVTINEKFVFTRPATVTGAFLHSSGGVAFHQMTLDHVENDEYVLQNTDFKDSSPGSKLYYQNLIFKISIFKVTKKPAIKFILEK